jgi:MSHA pilin protein MshD
VLSRRWDENTKVGGGPLCSGESGVGRGSKSYGQPLAVCPDASGDNLNASAVVGAESGENRQSYDDVDDYNSMNPETDTFTDQAGVSFTYTGYSRSVTVDYVASNGAVIDGSSPTSAGTTDTKRVRVTVTNPLGENFIFVGLACNF